MNSDNLRLPPAERTLPPDVPLLIEPDVPSNRRLEPVTCGIPWPRAISSTPAGSRCGTRRDSPSPSRFGSSTAGRMAPRWTLLDWQASVQGSASFILRAGAGDTVQPPAGPHVQVAAEETGAVRINTSAAEFQLRPGDAFPFQAVLVGGVAAIDSERTRFTVEDGSGHLYRPRIHRLHVEEAGPVRASLYAEGTLAADGYPLGDFFCRMHFFAGSATVRFRLTLRNPRRAEHPGGLGTSATAARSISATRP